MAGFKRQTTIYELKFEDPSLDGLEVRARSLPIGKLMKLMKVAVAIGAEVNGAASISGVDDLFKGFSEALVDWNLQEEDGTPVPTTLEAINDQDFEFVMPVIMAWIQAVAGVGAELGKGSNSGGTFPVGSLPMAPLSASPSS